MYDQLPILLQLQEIDSKIDKLENLKASEPTKLQALEAELTKFREIVQSKSNAVEELQKKRRSKDRQLSLQQAQIEKYKSQRHSVKTNKEYTALELEISELESACSAIEDEIIELMIAIDEANNELGLAKNELKNQEDIFRKRKEEILSEIEELDRQIAEWTALRKGFVGKIDPVLINRYNDWRKRRGSSLVAVIDGQACGSCHITLPPQLVNEVRKKEELHTCSNCGRILYWMDEDKSEQKS